MTECLCGHGEWCRHCTSIPLPPKKKEKPNYKYESFEEWFKTNDRKQCSMKVAFDAARETKEREG